MLRFLAEGALILAALAVLTEVQLALFLGLYVPLAILRGRVRHLFQSTALGRLVFGPDGHTDGAYAYRGEEAGGGTAPRRRPRLVPLDGGTSEVIRRCMSGDDRDRGTEQQQRTGSGKRKGPPSPTTARSATPALMEPGPRRPSGDAGFGSGLRGGFLNGGGSKKKKKRKSKSRERSDTAKGGVDDTASPGKAKADAEGPSSPASSAGGVFGSGLRGGFLLGSGGKRRGGSTPPDAPDGGGRGGAGAGPAPSPGGGTPTPPGGGGALAALATAYGSDDEPDGPASPPDGPAASSAAASSDAADDGDGMAANRARIEHDLDNYALDCYPYAFSPLLLFSSTGYFDRGYSNYNAVAAFFAPCLEGLGAGADEGGGDVGRGDGDDAVPADGGGAGASAASPAPGRRHSLRASARGDGPSPPPGGGVDMLRGVLYDRKNMQYDELILHLAKNQMLVTCCIDAHFTAFQMISTRCMLYYDPTDSSVGVWTREGDVFKNACYFLMKCNYGDNNHIIENEKYYRNGSTPLAKTVWKIWKDIHSMKRTPTRPDPVRLNLKKWLFVNGERDFGAMSTQLTDCTCYFQTYLFALLCKVGKPSLNRDGRTLDFRDAPLLEAATIRMSKFLLTFFVNHDDGDKVVRPYTNSNFILDFYRFRSSPYWVRFVKYLRYQGVPSPAYEKQYETIMAFYCYVKELHGYDRFVLEGATSSTPNSKSLQLISSADGGQEKLGRGDYYKYRACNLMFGCNANIMMEFWSFSEFNAWRKNQLLAFYGGIKDRIADLPSALARNKVTKYRDYYFMPQFEIGQRELIDLHHYTYVMDMISMGVNKKELATMVADVNKHLVYHIYFSQNNRNNYHKMMKTDQFVSARKYMNVFLETFLTVSWFTEFVALGFADMNPREKEINSMTQTVFYSIDLMRGFGYRQEYEFEKEAINQMARTTIRRYDATFAQQSVDKPYRVVIPIGLGFTYSKYNTLMHFLNVAATYWANPDVNNIQVFGKDVRTLLAISCQKIFFAPGHGSGYYHYGPLEVGYYGRPSQDLAVTQRSGVVTPSVANSGAQRNTLIVTDRVYEYSYLRGILRGLFERAGGKRVKSDNSVLNLLLLSLQLDFGLFDEYAGLLNIPFMQDLQHEADTRELQVEIANMIYDFDRKHTENKIMRSHVEGLIFEVSYKFLVNKGFHVKDEMFKIISTLNTDSDYQEYVLLVKIYMSLCSINKSVEVDYYKMKVDGSYNIVIPSNYSKKTSAYLENITSNHSFAVHDGIMTYDGIQVYDLRPHQPEINLYKIKLEPNGDTQSMVKYIEITNAFQAISTNEQYLIFIADNVILVDICEDGNMKVRINKVDAQASAMFFNEAISFIPCFKFTEGDDVIIFTSKNMHFLVDKGGQFCPDYYGMKHELMECIESLEVFSDLNDDPKCKNEKLCNLVTESKVTVYFPDYLLLVTSRQQLINLLDYAVYIRNLGLFILVLFQLKRVSFKLEYRERDPQTRKIVQITGPWKEAILYVIKPSVVKDREHYDDIFNKQFTNLKEHKDLPLREFIEELCDKFKRYQRQVDGEYQIIPREKQKRFLERIITGEECFHFSEVGSGKTKVIMPLLCQIFLSNNTDAHKHLSRGGKKKDTLIILVPEHLLPDAKAQVYRHCLNLNFRDEYKIYDDILYLLHEEFKLGGQKMIFVTSFNQFKKILTFEGVCRKVMPHREKMLVVADEVDDFLDRDKLVFNICSNKANSFDRATVEYFHECSQAAYHGTGHRGKAYESSPNPTYWKELHAKFVAINAEIQDASKSLNKSFGVFNEQTLRHCTTDIAHDIEGYKALIARPFQSVNRAMPGSYYSDVERTIFLTFVILSEDTSKYDELFQNERKFITFEYWKEFLPELDYDELVYGHDRISEVVERHPRMAGGLIRFMYGIILRRMEVRYTSRSVNSVDIIFNFDTIGFTGTPFLDNYPTSDYIRRGRFDDIPPCIDRSFYAYTNENLPKDEFESRFKRFQGDNKNVQIEYVSSDFMSQTLEEGEMETLEAIFRKEEAKATSSSSPFNVVVDLCGIFKLTDIYDVRELILKHFGSDVFHYIYHIDQTDGSDKMLCIKSQNNVTFDEEFYKYLCRSYGENLGQKVFFFIDNRNYIGKDVPYQLVYQKHYKVPLFLKSVVIAHDVDDFSKIWQAMGRSRTMNDTTFSIYKNNIPANLLDESRGVCDIKDQPLTSLLYTRNCDSKMAGNLSSIYQTLIALFNLGKESFYYNDKIVNVFVDKMEKTIEAKVKSLHDNVARVVIGNQVTARILQHILLDKFRRSSNESLSQTELVDDTVNSLLRQIVTQKFEQRQPSRDIYDDYIRFLSGEQESLMEISYTKQQQKQKQNQKAKSQDNDTMDVFDKRHQWQYKWDTKDYFRDVRHGDSDKVRRILSLPMPVPVFQLKYIIGGKTGVINVYPTIQFLYSHHIKSEYIDKEVQAMLNSLENGSFHTEFLKRVNKDCQGIQEIATKDKTQCISQERRNCIRPNSHYSLVGIQPGVYVIGMKDQFNVHDRATSPLSDHLKYGIDDVGFVLFDSTNTKDVDTFGPYFIEQYILLDALSKQEMAQNVISYYCNHKEKLNKCLANYDERQGKGFICWRFLFNQVSMK